MSKARILIVEDEVIIALQLEEKLKSLGYDVTSTVNNADDAIQKAEEDKPDLILMDIRIQGDKDGIETAEIIRNKFGIPVIFSTAYLDYERIERAKTTMPFGYVLKPIQERDLKVTLEMALYVAKMDAKRRKAEEFLIKVGEMAQVGGWEIYPENRGIYLSEVVKDIYEVPHDYDPDYDEAMNFFPEKSKRILDEAVGEAIEKGKSYELELDFVTAKDNLRRVKTIGHSIIENGKCVRLYGVFQDITDQKQAEEELVLQANLLDVVENSVIVTDILGKVLYWNPFAEKIYGWSAEEAIGRTTIDLIAAEESAQYGAEIMEALQSGKSWSGEYLARNKNGEKFYIHSTTTPIYNEKEKLTNIIGISFDITHQKKAEESIIESKKVEKLLQGVIDGSQTITSVKDIDGKYILISNKYEEEFGIKQKDIIGKTDFDFLPNELAERYKKQDQKVIISGDAIVFEEEFDWNNTLTKYIIKKYPLLDMEDSVKFVCVESLNMKNLSPRS